MYGSIIEINHTYFAHEWNPITLRYNIYIEFIILDHLFTFIIFLNSLYHLFPNFISIYSFTSWSTLSVMGTSVTTSTSRMP